MSRKQSLEQLKIQLSERRKELRKMLNGRNKRAAATTRLRTGDVGDASLYNASSDMSTRMAAMESDELRQIETALKKFKASSYGVCEISGKQIPIARLRALPFTRFSVGSSERARSEWVV